MKNPMSPDSLPLPEKILAIVRYLLLLASPFIAYIIDKPKAFIEWIIFLLTWGILIWLINLGIGIILSVLPKNK